MATVQVRNVPEDVHETFRRRAKAAGKSLQEYLVDELTELGRARSFADVLAEVQEEMDADPSSYSKVSAVSIIRADRESH